MTVTCLHCGNDDESMLEEIGFTAGPVEYAMNTTGMSEVEIEKAHERYAQEDLLKSIRYHCESCSKDFTLKCN